MTMLAHIMFLVVRLSFAALTVYAVLRGLDYSYHYDVYVPLMSALGL